MTTEIEKAQLGAETLNAFFNSFGGKDDPYAAVLLEILLEELMNAKAVSILGKSEQERDQVSHDVDGRIDSHIKGDRPETT